jgi:hypothetical protein
MAALSRSAYLLPLNTPFFMLAKGVLAPVVVYDVADTDCPAEPERELRPFFMRLGPFQREGGGTPEGVSKQGGLVKPGSWVGGVGGGWEVEMYHRVKEAVCWGQLATFPVK